MRRSCLPALLALGLLVAPLAATPTLAVAAPAGPVQASATAAGSATTTTRLARAATASPTETARTTSRRALKRPRAVRPVVTPAGKPASKPASKPATGPVAAPAAVTAPAVTAPSPVGLYAFLHVDSGKPVRWNPCADVPWTFNPAGAPAGGLAAVQAALAEIGRRTGLTFAYQGTTAQAPAGSYLQQGWKQFRPLLVGWTTAAESDLLAGRSSSTVGLARVLWTGSYDSSGVNHTQIASGVVALNRATQVGTTGPGSWYTYLLHELGHAVGLAHVEDETQVMNPVISSRVAGFGSGDVAGLVRLGSGAGCLPAVR